MFDKFIFIYNYFFILLNCLFNFIIQNQIFFFKGVGWYILTHVCKCVPDNTPYDKPINN